MTIHELKAQAYDIIATIEAHSREIEGLKQKLMETNKMVSDAIAAEAAKDNSPKEKLKKV